jgi:hypothetical protein
VQGQGQTPAPAVKEELKKAAEKVETVVSDEGVHDEL